MKKSYCDMISSEQTEFLLKAMQVMLPQITIMFAGTRRNNLDIGVQAFSDEDIYRVLEIVHLIPMWKLFHLDRIQ